MPDDNTVTFDEILRNTAKCSLYAPEVITPREDIDLHPRSEWMETTPNIRDFNAVSIDSKGKVNLDRKALVEYLVANRIVCEEKVPYRYNGQIYERIHDDDISDLIYRAMAEIPEAPFLSRSTVADIIAYFKAISQVQDLHAPSEWDMDDYCGELAVFRNGIYNIDTDRLLGFTPYIFITYQMDVEYNPKIKTSKAEGCLAKILPDEETRDFFYQLAGYILFSQSLSPPGIFCIYGPGGTGKSGLDKMLRATLGNCNISNLKPHQISKDFMVGDLKDKMLNISGETGQGQRSMVSEIDGELLKQLSDGQMIQADRKHKNSITFQNYAKMLFITNQLPNFGDSTSGMTRRMYIIPCRRQQDWSDQLHTHMTTPEACSWFANKALHAYREFLARDRSFIISNEMAQELRSYKVQDALGEYLESRYGTFDRAELSNCLDGVMVDDIFQDYQFYVREGGGKPLSRRGLSERLRNEYNLTSKRIRAVQTNGAPTNRIMLVRIGTE